MNMEKYVTSGVMKDINKFVETQEKVPFTMKNIYKMLEIIDVCDVKLVNLKKFYDDLNLDYGYHIYIEKCRYFGPSPLEKKIHLSSGICVGYY